MKIAIKGAYGETNFGDDLLMMVFENYFRTEFPEAELNFIGNNALYVDKLLQKAQYNALGFSADWLVYGGGTQFFSFSGKSRTLIEKAKMAAKNPNLIKKKVVSRIGGKTAAAFSYKKIAFLGFGIGPFYNNEKVILAAKDKLAKANFIGVRDEISKKYCDDWNLEAMLGADVVFSSYFDKNKLLSAKIKNNESGKKKIGIIIRDWKWEKEGGAYIEKVMQYYKQNKHSEQYELQFIIFAPKVDKEVIEMMKGEQVLIWEPNTTSVTQFMDKLNTFDGFVSARYHGAIIGVLLNKPVICIEIEDKLRILCRQIPELVLWEKPFEIDALVNKVSSIARSIDYTGSIEKLSIKADAMLGKIKDVWQLKY